MLKDGGGYGAGYAGSFDFSYIGQTVNNGFVSVAIQYRLGAFGFLSSADVAKQGTVNAGVHDMRFALQWVKKYIGRFGGDPDQVTISGESAGGGAVMLMAMMNGGGEGTSLFRRGIASSPYFPTQPYVFACLSLSRRPRHRIANSRRGSGTLTIRCPPITTPSLPDGRGASGKGVMAATSSAACRSPTPSRSRTPAPTPATPPSSASGPSSP